MFLNSTKFAQGLKFAWNFAQAWTIQGHFYTIKFARSEEALICARIGVWAQQQYSLKNIFNYVNVITWCSANSSFSWNNYMMAVILSLPHKVWLTCLFQSRNFAAMWRPLLATWHYYLMVALTACVSWEKWCPTNVRFPTGNSVTLACLNSTSCELNTACFLLDMLGGSRFDEVGGIVWPW